MSDKVLKELLKEERRRSKSHQGRDHKDSDKNHHKDRSHKDKKDKSHKERDHKSSHKHKSRHHRSKSEGSSVTQVVAQPSPEPVDEREKFMFVYEDEEGKLYTKIDEMGLTEGQKVKIFPVYFKGGNENLAEETVTYVDSKLTSEVENSWLEIIHSTDENLVIFEFDLTDIAVSNGKFFYTDGALIDYITEFDAEYLPIHKNE